MADPWAVCVVPAAGDPGGLLACRRLPIPAQSRLPIVVGTTAMRPPEVTGWSESSPLWPTALPLWWDGALVPEGWDRARRVSRLAEIAGWADHVWEPDSGSARLLGELLVVAGVASRVVLLDLVDGRLVERVP